MDYGEELTREGVACHILNCTWFLTTGHIPFSMPDSSSDYIEISFYYKEAIVASG